MDHGRDGRGRDLAALVGRRALFEAKGLASRHRLSLLVARLRQHGVPVGPKTEILIEGFPRSANSFSVAAFRLAQDRPVEIAHHTHAPANALKAIRRHIPTLILVRAPMDSVLEYLILRPRLTARQVVRAWIEFYATLLPRRGEFVVGAFPQVISDFGPVIRRVNDRFGTTFREFDHTAANVQECFRQMEAYWSVKVGSGDGLERIVGRPSVERERWKTELVPRYLEVPPRFRDRARELFEELSGSAP